MYFYISFPGMWYVAETANMCFSVCMCMHAFILAYGQIVMTVNLLPRNTSLWKITVLHATLLQTQLSVWLMLCKMRADHSCKVTPSLSLCGVGHEHLPPCRGFVTAKWVVSCTRIMCIQPLSRCSLMFPAASFFSESLFVLLLLFRHTFFLFYLWLVGHFGHAVSMPD